MELCHVCLDRNNSISSGSVFLGAGFVPKGFPAPKVFPHSVCCVSCVSCDVAVDVVQCGCVYVCDAACTMDLNQIGGW